MTFLRRHGHIAHDDDDLPHWAMGDLSPAVRVTHWMPMPLTPDGEEWQK